MDLQRCFQLDGRALAGVLQAAAGSRLACAALSHLRLQGLLRPESLVAGNRHHLLQGLEQCWWLQERQLLPPQLTAVQPALCTPLQLL